MAVPSLQLMYQLWHTKGARLSTERVNGHDRSQYIMNEGPLNKCLVENFKQAEKDQDE